MRRRRPRHHGARTAAAALPHMRISAGPTWRPCARTHPARTLRPAPSVRLPGFPLRRRRRSLPRLSHIKSKAAHASTPPPRSVIAATNRIHEHTGTPVARGSSQRKARQARDSPSSPLKQTALTHTGGGGRRGVRAYTTRAHIHTRTSRATLHASHIQPPRRAPPPPPPRLAHASWQSREQPPEHASIAAPPPPPPQTAHRRRHSAHCQSTAPAGAPAHAA